MFIRTKILYALGMYGGALLAHSLLWFVYEKLQFSLFTLAFTPLIFCMMYHFALKDCGKDETVGKGFATLFMAVLPFLTFGSIAIVMFISNSELSIFSIGKEYSGTFSEAIGVYALRATVSSIYVVIFALFEHIHLLFKRGK